MRLRFIRICKRENPNKGLSQNGIKSLKDVCAAVLALSSAPCRFTHTHTHTAEWEVQIWRYELFFSDRAVWDLSATEIDFPLTTFIRRLHWFYWSFFCCFGHWCRRLRSRRSFGADFCHCSERKMRFRQKTWFFFIWKKERAPEHKTIMDSDGRTCLCITALILWLFI